MTAMLERLAPPTRSQKRKLPAVAATRLTHTEMNDLRRAAAEVGMSVSDYVRSLVISALLGDEPVIS
jgi:hypothetical protein